MTIDTLADESSGYKEDASTVNIQNKHPVSFNYNATVVSAINGAVTPPAVKGAVYDLPMDTGNGTSANQAVADMVAAAGGRIECTICHDPHENKASDNRDILPFWVSKEVDASGQGFGVLSSYEAVCVSCHARNFGEYTGFSDYTSLR
jgi:hypothetical protein